MTVRRLERREWSGFCVRASRYLLGKQVQIEVASLQIGLQPRAPRLPLVRMTYDARSDILVLLVGEVSYHISAPREFYVDEGPLQIASFEIIDALGTQQIVTLWEPLMLPAPPPARE